MRSCGSSLNRDTVKEEVDEGSSNISKIKVCFTILTQSAADTLSATAVTAGTRAASRGSPV